MSSIGKIGSVLAAPAVGAGVAVEKTASAIGKAGYIVGAGVGTSCVAAGKGVGKLMRVLTSLPVIGGLVVAGAGALSVCMIPGAPEFVTSKIVAPVSDFFATKILPWIPGLGGSAAVDAVANGAAAATAEAATNGSMAAGGELANAMKAASTGLSEAGATVANGAKQTLGSLASLLKFLPK